MGAEAVRKMLNDLDLVELSKELRTELEETGSKQKAKDLVNRLKIVEAIRDSENNRHQYRDKQKTSKSSEQVRLRVVERIPQGWSIQDQ